MIAIAPDDETACQLLVRDLEACGLRVLEVTDVRELFEREEIKEIDASLATNFTAIEPGKQTVWGTIHCYKGDGEA